MSKLRFRINEESYELDGLAPTTTVLRFLRDRAGLNGTKEGCAEGDCGACTVAVREEVDGQAVWRSACSCLLFLPMVQGKQLLTVEGIGKASAPHLVQEALASALGSQCGYCTPGVTMALFEACYRKDLDERWKLDAQMCGNLCRCTGYRPIRDAAQAVAGVAPADRFQRALEGERGSMRLDYQTPGQRYATPESMAELWTLLATRPGARLVAGGTDLALEVTKRYAEPESLISLEALPLRALQADAQRLSIGAGVDLSTLEAFARETLPPLERMLRYFGSRQIKNRATVGGNLCTASPIGDLAPVFLALGATAVLASASGERRVPMEAFFTGYRKTALAPGEILAAVEVPRPRGARAASYKVSKRRELDISTVSACFAVRLDASGRVEEARFAYGGMAATPARAARAEGEVRGQPWTEAVVRAAMGRLAEDFQPISDHRGSAWYRAELARNLLLGFYLETELEVMPRLTPGHAATVQVR